MIRVEYVDGRACPLVRCDGCGEQITDAGMAGVVWPLNAGPEFPQYGEGPTIPRFLCKTNRCLSRCDWPWEELSTWLVFLVGNVGLDGATRWRDAQGHAEFARRCR